MNLLVGAAGCCFILGLALWPDRSDVISSIWPSYALFFLSAALLTGAACT